MLFDVKYLSLDFVTPYEIMYFLFVSWTENFPICQCLLQLDSLTAPVKFLLFLQGKVEELMLTEQTKSPWLSKRRFKHSALLKEKHLVFSFLAYQRTVQGKAAAASLNHCESCFYLWGSPAWQQMGLFTSIIGASKRIFSKKSIAKDRNTQSSSFVVINVCHLTTTNWISIIQIKLVWKSSKEQNLTKYWLLHTE